MAENKKITNEPISTFWKNNTEPIKKLATEMSELSTDSEMLVLSYLMLLFRTILICMISVFQIGWRYEDEAQSLFERNREFKIIGIGAIYGVSSVGVILWFTVAVVGLQRYVRDIHYTILKFVGSFSAFVAPFSLLMVLAVPSNLNLIAYLFVFFMFGIIAASFYLDDQQQNNTKRHYDFNDLVMPLTLLLICVPVCIPRSLDWFAYRFICVYLWMEVTYHFITYLMFINQKSRNVEAQKLIQDKNTCYPRNNYLQVLGRNCQEVDQTIINV